MKRRTVVLNGGAALAAAALGAVPMAGRSIAQPAAPRDDAWKIADLRAGGTADVPATLPAPAFRDSPQCVVTARKILGPCHTGDVPIRRDIAEGVTGLPMEVGLRIVEAATCRPIPGADVEIWHTDVRGVYSGRAATMCNAGDAPARQASFLRGRQITGADGVARFVTVYPGWYGGRTPHIHLRVVIGSRELLVSQLIFDDALNDLIYAGHPDYIARPKRDTRNDADRVFSSGEVERFTFDVTRLEPGILQASYTIGLATQPA